MDGRKGRVREGGTDSEVEGWQDRQMEGWRDCQPPFPLRKVNFAREERLVQGFMMQRFGIRQTQA